MNSTDGLKIEGGRSTISDIEFSSYDKMIELQLRMIFEANNYLYKGIMTYLTISAFLVGYFFTQDVDIEIRRYFVKLVIVISVFFSISASALLLGIARGLSSLKLNIGKISSAANGKIELDTFMKRGIRTVYVLAFCAFGVGICIIMALIKLNSLDSNVP